MSKIGFGSLVLSLSLSLAQLGCENCPDRSVGLSVTPTDMDRNVATTLRLKFAQDVFLESSPARERDIRISLSGPIQGANAPSIANWNGSTPTPDSDTIGSVTGVDARTMTVVLKIDPTNAAGSYRLEVVADSAGACSGPNGVVDLAVR
jgi:hypothetical protein